MTPPEDLPKGTVHAPDSGDASDAFPWQALFAPGTPVLALPHWRAPRLYLPSAGAAQRWRDADFYPAFRRAARAYRLALRAKAALGLGRRRRVDGFRWPLAEFVDGAVPLRSVVALVGTPGPAQKLIARLLDEHGACVGYLKLARKPAARRRLAHEAELLAALPSGVAPRLLARGPLLGGEAILISPLAGDPPAAALPPPAALRDFIAALCGALDHESRPLEHHPGFADLLAASREPDAPEWLRQRLDDLAGRAWPLAPAHGDLAPWNLLQAPDGTLRALDWEYGALRGLPWFDVAYYLLQVAALIHRWPPARAGDYAVDYLSASPWPRLAPREAAAVVALGAFRAHRQALRDGHPPDAPLQAWRQGVWRAANRRRGPAGARP